MGRSQGARPRPRWTVECPREVLAEQITARCT